MDYRKLTNEELVKAYTGKRGDLASEMCRRAGTRKYLYEYATYDDKKFDSCMRDTIAVLNKRPTLRGTEV